MCMVDLNILSRFSVNTPYKFLLYLSTGIFLASLFLPMQGFNVRLVQHRSLIVMCLGLVTWFLEYIIHAAFFYHAHRRIFVRAERYVWYLIVVQGLYISASFFVIFIF
jgi:hypothetical protein